MRKRRLRKLRKMIGLTEAECRRFGRQLRKQASDTELSIDVGRHRMSGREEAAGRERAIWLDRLGRYLLDLSDAPNDDDEDHLADYARRIFGRLEELSEIEAESAELTQECNRNAALLLSFDAERDRIKRYVKDYLAAFFVEAVGELCDGAAQVCLGGLSPEARLAAVKGYAAQFAASFSVFAFCNGRPLAHVRELASVGEALEMAVESEPLGGGDGSVSGRAAELDESGPKLVGHVE